MENAGANGEDGRAVGKISGRRMRHLRLLQIETCEPAENAGAGQQGPRDSERSRLERQRSVNLRTKFVMSLATQEGRKTWLRKTPGNG